MKNVMKKLLNTLVFGFTVLSTCAVVNASESNNVTQGDVAAVVNALQEKGLEVVKSLAAKAQVDTAPEIKEKEAYTVAKAQPVQNAYEGTTTRFNWWLPLLALALTLGLLYLARNAARKYALKQKAHYKEKDVHKGRTVSEHERAKKYKKQGSRQGEYVEYDAEYEERKKR